MLVVALRNGDFSVFDDGLGVGAVDIDLTIDHNVLGVVILDRRIHVLLRPDIDLFAAGLIFELKIVRVIAGSTLTAAGENTGLRLIGGQIPGAASDRRYRRGPR